MFYFLKRGAFFLGRKAFLGRGLDRGRKLNKVEIKE